MEKILRFQFPVAADDPIDVPVPLFKECFCYRKFQIEGVSTRPVPLFEPSVFGRMNTADLNTVNDSMNARGVY